MRIATVRFLLRGFRAKTRGSAASSTAGRVLARRHGALGIGAPGAGAPVPALQVPALQVPALQEAGASERACPLLIACTRIVAPRTSPVPNRLTFCRAAAGKAPKRPLGR